ncbi:MAG: UDP-N-acetylglucosamine 1-carboxyvinyltransferase [Alphaproteobacteria bacterium]
MYQLRIVGGRPLKGDIVISGAKNAALPLMAASLLTGESLTLHNVPRLADILSMVELLTQHGAVVEELASHTLRITAANIDNLVAPYDIVRKMRASIMVLGPLVARYGKAKVSLPGGCVIGTRPVDLHLNGLKALGAEINLNQGYIEAEAPQGLVGATISLPMITVTGTENLMMAACLAKGETRIINAALEPEVVDLANCLIAMGAIIEGAGTNTIVIQGVDELHGAEHTVIPDRIETGSYLVAAAITGSDIRLLNTSLDLLPGVTDRLKQAGLQLEAMDNGIHIHQMQQAFEGVDVMTEPFPGFATDLQAQMMTLMTMANGASMITETVFENRFMHVPELGRMGANITVHGASALVRGTRKLYGAEVMATDIRASVSLVLAALAAEGETIINRIYHLDRGYEALEDKLNACGALIERIQRSDS